MEDDFLRIPALRWRSAERWARHWPGDLDCKNEHRTRRDGFDYSAGPAFLRLHGHADSLKCASLLGISLRPCILLLYLIFF